MAAVAGIGDLELFRQQGIRDGKPVIAAGVALHISRLGHMTSDTLIACRPHRMMRMSRRIDLWRWRVWRRVAGKAQTITCEARLARVGIMAINATNSGRAHSAAQKGGEFVVLIMHLSIGVKSLGLVRDRQGEVIEKVISRLEIAGQLHAT